MQVNLVFEYASIIISVLLLVYFGTAKKVASFHNKIFASLVVINAVTALFDVINKIMSYKGVAVLWLDVTTMGYLVTHLIVLPLTFFYVLTSVKDWYDLGLRLKVITITPIILVLCSLLTNPFTNFIYTYEADGTYIRGEGYILLYGITAFYMIFMLFLLFYYKKHFTLIKRVTIIIQIVAIVLSMAVQFVFVDYRLETFGITYGFLIMFFMIQNPHDQVDKETGLYNKKAFFDVMRKDMASKKYFNLIEVIITDYNEVTGTLTSESDNTIAYQIGEYLKDLCEGDSVYRVESNLFCVSLSSMAEEDVIKFIRCVRNRFTYPWNQDGYEILFNIKICHIAVPEDIDNINQLIGIVNGVGVKQINKEILSVSDFDLGKLERQSGLNAAISQAFDNNSIEIVFSPSCKLEDKRIVSADTSFRLFDSEIGYIEEDEIIEYAEKNSRIGSLSKLQLDKLIKFMVENNPAKLGLRSVVVMLTSAMCHQVGFIDYLIKSVEENHINPDSICFRISEYTVHQAPELIASIMDELHSKGFRFCLDDYGSGFTNISSIYELSFDVIKISDSVVREALSNSKAKITFESSLELATSLGMRTVVGGIDSEELFELSLNAGCELAQGPYFLSHIDGKELINILVSQENNFALSGVANPIDALKKGGIA